MSNISKPGSTSLGTLTLGDAMKARNQETPVMTIPSTPAQPAAPVNDELARLRAEMEALRADNEALKAKHKGRAPGLSMKVSEKGAVSVYGLGRFPVTLYISQWQRLLSEQFREDFAAFDIANTDNPKLIREKAAKPVDAEPAKT
jgi:hypothetical protein